MKNAPNKNKPARWAYLDELDGRPTDDTPIHSHARKPALWECVLYGVTALLWIAALLAAILKQVGTTGFLLLGLAVIGLRLTVYEARRKKRCKGSLLGTVESVTRPHIRKNTRYPVIRFEVEGTVYRAHGQKPCHPSTQGNEEWVSYNPQDPADCYVTSDAKLKAALLLTVIAGALGVIFLILEAT